MPPFHDEHNYISLRASPAECLDRSNWGKNRKEYVYGRNLCFYQIRFSKDGYKWLFQQGIIKELGKGASSQKQWVHLQRKTNVKSKAMYKDFPLWEADLLSRADMEALVNAAAPSGRSSVAPVASSLPPPAASAPAGVWSSFRGNM